MDSMVASGTVVVEREEDGGLGVVEGESSVKPFVQPGQVKK
jgi:hypothetical protein